MPRSATEAPSRLVVVDVGSNTIHAMVMHREHPGLWRQVQERKFPIRLGGFVEGQTPNTRSLSQDGIEALTATLREVRAQFDCPVRAFATSAVRDSINCDQVVAHVAQLTGVSIDVLTGENEARLTYWLAAQWAAGQHNALLGYELALLDIGGGSVEVAYGRQEQVQGAVSLPIGTAWLSSQTEPGLSVPDAVARWNTLLNRQWATVENVPLTLGDRVVVGTSKTVSTLADLCAGQVGQPRLSRAQLEELIPNLPEVLDDRELVKRLGISPGRAQQSLAGAVIAASFLRWFHVEHLQVCRAGALREAYRDFVLNAPLRPAEQSIPPAPTGDQRETLKLGGNVAATPSPASGSSGDRRAAPGFRPVRRTRGPVNVVRLPRRDPGCV